MTLRLNVKNYLIYSEYLQFPYAQMCKSGWKHPYFSMLNMQDALVQLSVVIFDIHSVLLSERAKGSSQVIPPFKQMHGQSVKCHYQYVM